MALKQLKPDLSVTKDVTWHENDKKDDNRVAKKSEKKCLRTLSRDMTKIIVYRLQVTFMRLS